MKYSSEMSFAGIVNDGQLNLPNAQRELRESFLSSIKSGTSIEETIRILKPSKTNKQLATIFGLVLTQIIMEFNDRGWDSSIILKLPNPTGVGVSKELLKEFFYAVCPMNNKTLSRASIEDAMKFIDEIRNFAASQWQIVIPDPNPRWRESTDANNGL